MLQLGHMNEVNHTEQDHLDQTTTPSKEEKPHNNAYSQLIAEARQLQTDITNAIQEAEDLGNDAAIEMLNQAKMNVDADTFAFDHQINGFLIGFLITLSTAGFLKASIGSAELESTEVLTVAMISLLPWLFTMVLAILASRTQFSSVNDRMRQALIKNEEVAIQGRLADGVQLAGDHQPTEDVTQIAETLQTSTNQNRQ
jgi:hypothetical protein